MIRLMNKDGRFPTLGSFTLNFQSVVMDKKVVIIDNYDSFTHIIKQYVGELNGNPEVYFNDEITVAQLEKIKPTHLILSPGPGTVDVAKDAGVMLDVIEAFYQTIPILGVCLGHQALAKYFGGSIIPAPKIMHGKRSMLYHDRKNLFKGIQNPTMMMRYHSLMVKLSFWLSDDFEVTAHTDELLIMAIEHQKYPVFGVQFHPESLGSTQGKKLIQNFLNTTPAS